MCAFRTTNSHIESGISITCINLLQHYLIFRVGFQRSQRLAKIVAVFGSTPNNNFFVVFHTNTNTQFALCYVCCPGSSELIFVCSDCCSNSFKIRILKQLVVVSRTIISSKSREKCRSECAYSSLIGRSLIHIDRTTSTNETNCASRFRSICECFCCVCEVNRNIFSCFYLKSRGFCNRCERIRV